MKVAVGADHRGFALKEHLKHTLLTKGIEVIDKGAQSTESSDYPDYALSVGEAVSADQADWGLLVCATGIGISMAANKVPGIRAALVHSPEDAELSRRHNDANVLCLSGMSTSPSQADEILDHWLNSTFEGGRHARRIQKVTDYENRHAKE